MPWKDKTIMDQCYRFILDYQSQEDSLAQLCRDYGINRRTAYKWLARYQEAGVEGLKDRSHARKTQAQLTPPAQEELILAARAAHPLWGAPKLKALLERRHAGLVLPAQSTIGLILKRHGLTVPRKRLRHATPMTAPLAHAQASNSVWCVDFKGWFLTGDGQRCDPLTISDAYSRFLVRCQAVAKTDGEHVRAIFEAAFRQHGLPRIIRSDNGPPLCLHRPGRTLPAVGLVAAPGHPARAYPAGQTARERASRADAPDVAAGGGHAARGQWTRPAATL